MAAPTILLGSAMTGGGSGGGTFDPTAPGPIGGTTPAAGTFTTLTATGAALMNGGFTVTDTSDTTKKVTWNAASQTTGITLTLKAQQSTSQTLAYPNITGADTLGALGLAQTWTAVQTFVAPVLGVATATSLTTGNITMNDATNVILNATTGTKIGTATTQKLGFYNSTPIVQPTGDIITALQNLGLGASLTVTATTNANLTGPIASTGNTTSITAQTGTGTTFAMSAGPTFTGTTTIATGSVTGVLTNSNATDCTALGTAAVVLSAGGLSVNNQLRVGGNITGSATISGTSITGTTSFTCTGATGFKANGSATTTQATGSCYFYRVSGTLENAGSAIIQTDLGQASGIIGFYTGQTTSTRKAHISALGSVVIGTGSALATNATDGFLYIPSFAGTPTGVPTSFTGSLAFGYDSTNNKLYVYNGAWKATAALA